MPTKIEWTEETWNPITGCEKLTVGCAHCYAERMAQRLRGRFGYPPGDPFFPGIVHDGQFDKPLRWKKPRQVFVCSMGDLFHDWVERDDIRRVFDVMRRCPQHTFQLLTKRPQNMLAFAAGLDDWPANVWAGVTVERSGCESRLAWLRQVPAPIRFVSVEPMLSAVELDSAWHWIDWVICGAETGPQARPCQQDWARALRDRCRAMGVPFFFKRDSDGRRTLDGQQYEQRPMRADHLVALHGEALIGRVVMTQELGGWLGDFATITALSPDPEAPELVMQVEHDVHGEIGVFWHEILWLQEEGQR